GAMTLEDMLDDGQTKAGTPLLTATRTIDSVKTLGDERQMPRIDSNALVDDLEYAVSRSFRTPGHFHGAVLLTVIERIVDQIRESAVQLPFNPEQFRLAFDF